MTSQLKETDGKYKKLPAAPDVVLLKQRNKSRQKSGGRNLVLLADGSMRTNVLQSGLFFVGVSQLFIVLLISLAPDIQHFWVMQCQMFGKTPPKTWIVVKQGGKVGAAQSLRSHCEIVL